MSAVKRLYRETRARLQPLRARWRDAEGALLAHHVLASRSTPKRSIPHTLPAPLIVSFTSYPPRFRTLALTARCLLSQSIRPDRVVLWIAENDVDSLPGDVLRLQSRGLEIRSCPDLRSFKKLVPAIERWPHAFIATADDDVFYPRTWLSGLIAGLQNDASIPCHRARRLVLNGAGSPSLYLRWRLDPPNQPPSPLTFPIGVGGVLYPPHSLHPDVTDAETFMALCPTSDDAWFYWMARRAGRTFRRISNWRPVSWPGTQRVGLQHWNVPLDNDVQIARLTQAYGFPPQPETVSAPSAAISAA